MADKIDQTIKGDGNSQIIVQGNYIVGLNQDEVISLIKTFDYVNKDDVVEVVKEVMDNIPVEKMIQPDKRVFVPLIQQLSYSMEEEYIKIRYKKILESTMNIEKAGKVHPSFLSILSQLSSDELKILNSLPLTPLNSIPLINVRMKLNEKQGLGITLLKYFSDIGYGICEYPENICKYLENFERLKLIEIPADRHLVDESSYKKLINHPAIVGVRNENETASGIAFTYEYDKMYYMLTSFGIDFIKCCK